MARASISELANSSSQQNGSSSASGSGMRATIATLPGAGDSSSSSIRPPATREYSTPKGDGLKVNEGENITIRGVRVEWTRGPDTDNGAYGLYPVQTRNVLIEDSVVIGASDAGIYVGQSQNIVVRRNRAERNVAGVEIENCIGADVYDNVATGNTGGILVFNMSDLPQPGHTTRVFGNRVRRPSIRTRSRSPSTATASPAAAILPTAWT